MRCGIEVIHRRGAEYAEKSRRKTNIYFCIYFLCEPLSYLRLCGKSTRPRIGRAEP